jgi:hypothetical protein
MNADFTYTFGITVKGSAAINIKKINLDIELDAGT